MGRMAPTGDGAVFPSPQVWLYPALTGTKLPSGGVVRPKRSSPQLAMAPSSRAPPLWLSPALMEVYEPSGDVTGAMTSP